MRPLSENKLSKTEVIHVRRMKPGDIYIGRSCYGYRDSGWGNPFKIGAGQNREQIIVKYRQWILKLPTLMSRLKELKGKRLACWCKPAACHGDVLVELIEECYP